MARIRAKAIIVMLILGVTSLHFYLLLDSNASTPELQRSQPPAIASPPYRQNLNNHVLANTSPITNYKETAATSEQSSLSDEAKLLQNIAVQRTPNWLRDADSTHVRTHMPKWLRTQVPDGAEKSPPKWLRTQHPDEAQNSPSKWLRTQDPDGAQNTPKWLRTQDPEEFQSAQNPGNLGNYFPMTSVAWMKDLEEMDELTESHQMSTDYSILEKLDAIEGDLGEEIKVETNYSVMEKFDEVGDNSISIRGKYSDGISNSRNSIVQDLKEFVNQAKGSSTTHRIQTLGDRQANKINDALKSLGKSLNPHFLLNTTMTTESTLLKNTISFRIPISLAEVKQRYSKTTRTDIPEELYRLAPNVFDKVPPPDKFLDTFKSPCWHDGKQLQCLPFFYVAGMPKCGTSDLWAKINAHFDVHTMPKEPHWWSRNRIGKHGASTFLGVTQTGDIQRVPLESYLERYAVMAELMDNTGENLIAGDGSASTLWDFNVWEDYYPKYYDKGPPYVIGDVIHAVTPKAKIIVILRNPVDRLFSSYWFFWKVKKPSNKTFHELVVKEISEIKQCLQNRTIRACTYSLTKAGCAGDHSNAKLGITAGFYDIYIEDWLKAFPREQLLVLRLDDWSNRCKSVLPRIYTFLQIAPLRSTWINSLCEIKITRNEGPKRGIGDEMLPETRQLLEEIYMSHLENLAEIFEESKWYWGMVPESRR